MNKFEKLAAAMRDQVEHPDQDPREALQKAGLNLKQVGHEGKKKTKAAERPTNWMKDWEERQK